MKVRRRCRAVKNTDLQPGDPEFDVNNLLSIHMCIIFEGELCCFQVFNIMISMGRSKESSA